MSSDETKLKIILSFLVGLGVFLGLALRLFQIQISENDILSRSSHLRKDKLYRERGSIRDRNGNRLAFSIPAVGVNLDSRRLANPIEQERAAQSLGALLGIPSDELLPKLASGRAYIKLASKVDSEIADSIRRLRIPGIGFETEFRRVYPNGKMAASLLGFVGRDDTGLEGVEYSFEDYLRAEPGYKISMKAGGRVVVPGSTLEIQPPTGGDSVYLTIDEIIQHLVENELEEIFRRYEPKSAFILVMDPKNGEILALGARPSFDPNSYGSFPQSTWRNRAITDIFEPGSTFKIITAAAALDLDKLELDTPFECPGFIKLYDNAIGCTSTHGDLTLPDIIAKSCNVGIIKIGRVISPPDFYDYMQRFGFGQKTGLPFAGETKGILRAPKDWSGISIGALSIGQEVGVTVVQMASAISAVANGGVYNAPRLIDHIETADGELRELPWVKDRPPRRIIQAKTAKTISKMMTEVVVRGTGRRGSVDTWQAAGKTGTSQKLGMRRSFDQDEGYVASFVGYLPVRDPQALIYVVINEPKGTRSEIGGGSMAAPSFQHLAPKIMIYRDVPPDEGQLKDTLRSQGAGGPLSEEGGEASLSDVVYIGDDPIQRLLGVGTDTLPEGGP